MAAIARAETDLRAILHAHIYGADAEDLSAVVGRLLRERKLTLAVAESCTGGLLGRRITDVGGSSDYFVGGVIAYANRVKETLLAVDPSLITEHGAVSEPVVRAMAEGARHLHGTDVSIAVTGIAGPGGGTPDKPVGTVWLAVSIGDATRTRRSVFPGDREEIRERAAQGALALLWKQLTPLT
jgi:nicotinamide-nucleotide amidase